MQLNIEYPVLPKGTLPDNLPDRLRFIAQGYRNDALRYQGRRYEWRIRRAERLEKIAKGDAKVALVH